MKKHPVSDQSLQRFADGTATREESRTIVLHMLRGCASCAAALNAVLHPELPAGTYDAVFDRLASRLPPPGGGTVLSFEPRRVPAPVRPRREAVRHRQ